MTRTFTELNKGNIKNFADLMKGRLDEAVAEGKIKIVKPPTLFEPNIALALKTMICPYCYRRLYYNLKRTNVRCKSKKCYQKFFANIKT